MRTLPDSPNMDHLRQQAKDLLSQLRSTRPGAALSTAQVVVAQQYGFHAWTALKDEVDRRNANPLHAPDGAAEAVAKAFDLGTPKGPLVAVERQWAGQAWSLTTDRGPWLLRQLFDWYDGGDRETEAVLAEAAIGAGIKTPPLKRSTTGAIIQPIDTPNGRTCWRVFGWSPLGPLPSVPVDAKFAAAAGSIIGRVHALDLPPPRPVGSWLTRRRPEPEWWDLQREAARAEVSWADALAGAIPAIAEVSAIVDPGDPNDVAVLTACHFTPDAFRTAGDDLVVVLWEHAGAMPPRWDLGHALARWSAGVGTEDVNAPAAQALLDAYIREVPGVTVGEIDLGIFSADISAALNWTATRVHIALHAEDAARREVAEREVPELLATPPSTRRYERILKVLKD
jgi:hypothetical protein